MPRLILCIPFLFMPVGLLAQAESPALPIRLVPDGALSSDFSRIASVRELRDHRVVLADAKEKQLYVGDFRTGRTSPVGRHGSGPGEYLATGPLLAVGQDSTFMVDVLSHRTIVLERMRIIATLDASHPSGAFLSPRANAFSIDGTRRALAQVQRPFRPGEHRSTGGDSMALIRVTLGKTGVDTLAFLMSRPMTTRVATDAQGSEKSITRRLPAFSVGEQAVGFADGWIAVLRLNPYRVDWRNPRGIWIRGSALVTSETPVTSEHKRAYLTRFGFSPDATDRLEWPSTLPAVHDEFSAIPLATGELLVRRNEPANLNRGAYDVIDRRGSRVGVITLSEREYVVGAGTAGVYVVSVDNDDLQRLSRRRIFRE